jgi:hypothetical protein
MYSRRVLVLRHTSGATGTPDAHRYYTDRNMRETLRSRESISQRNAATFESNENVSKRYGESNIRFDP